MIRMVAGGVRALLQAGDAEDRALCEHLEAKLKELDNESVTGADGEEVASFERALDCA